MRMKWDVQHLFGSFGGRSQVVILYFGYCYEAIDWDWLIIVIEKWNESNKWGKQLKKNQKNCLLWVTFVLRARVWGNYWDSAFSWDVWLWCTTQK